VKSLDPTSSLVLTAIRVTIYASMLALVFIFAWAMSDFLGQGKPKVDVVGQPIEKIVAVFAKYDGAEFAKEMARTLAVDDSIVGDINLVKRGTDGRLHLVGWALDRQDISSSLDVFLVVPQKLVFMSSTGQKRDDVTKHFHMPREAAFPGFDAIFENRFDCNYNQKGPFLVAINQRKQFSVIKPRVQVSGC
jgi:hypothetical protein